MASVYSQLGGIASQSATSLDKTRRLFNFGDKIAELSPVESPFFSYLSKVGKMTTDDPVFKMLEQRHQWQRRNFYVHTAMTSVDPDGGITTAALKCLYDKFGRVSTTGQQPGFLIEGQMLSIEGTNDADGSKVIVVAKAGTVDLTTDTTEANVALTVHSVNSDTTAANWPAAITIASESKGQVIGSAWAEGSTDPDGWRDEMYDREGYCQIFKTAIPLFTGTTLATRYRGIANEWKRVWMEKLKEHKMDIEHASLFGVGKNDPTNKIRYSWGIVPYTELYGNIYNFTYAASTYDDFVDAMELFFAPELGNSGDKLVLASRKIIAYFNKIGQGTFLNNTVGSSQYRMDVQNIQGKFGHTVTKVSTVFGNLHFVAEPLFRGIYEDYAIMIDMKNVKWRPLAANGVSRDTHVITNVQNNNVDGRKDMCLTEAGLMVNLPETHALLKFS